MNLERSSDKERIEDKWNATVQKRNQITAIMEYDRRKIAQTEDLGKCCLVDEKECMWLYINHIRLKKQWVTVRA